MADEVSLGIKVFADGANLDGMFRLALDPRIAGFTTNPTLMRQSGVSDYEGFARKVLESITDRPISFEVFSDDFDEMARQADQIASWGPNVYVKIPVTNTHGSSAAPLIRRLSSEGLRLNVTALMTTTQVEVVADALANGPEAIISVFAGRIADTGVDPVPLMEQALETLAPHSNLELLWASPRELLNIIQADAIGCHIVTVTHDLLAKLPTFGKDLDQFSLETVRMFHQDAVAAGFVL
jgi:transaldolase